MKTALSASLTVRLPGPAARRVRARARAMGVTPSDLVRSALEREVGVLEDESSPYDLTRKWIGIVRDGVVVAARDARRELDTWDPDRRG